MDYYIVDADRACIYDPVLDPRHVMVVSVIGKIITYRGSIRFDNYILTYARKSNLIKYLYY